MAQRDHEEGSESLLRTSASLPRPLLPISDTEQQLETARAALRQAQQRVDQLVGHISDGFVLLGPDWRILQMNRNAAALLGDTHGRRHPAPGQNFWAVFAALAGGPLQTQLATVFASGNEITFEFDATQPPRRLAVRAHACPDGVSVYLRDMAEHTDRPDGAVQSDAAPHDVALRTLADALPQPAWIASDDNQTVWRNSHWYAYTGMTPQQMSGDGWQAVYDPACIPQMQQRWQQALRSGTAFEMEMPIRGADGHLRWFLTRASPIGDALPGTVRHWFGTCTDVDQVKRVQEALRDESTILELINQTGNALASTHDLRTLLQEVTDAATRISGARFGAFYYNGTGLDGSPLQLYTQCGAAPAQFRHFGDSGAMPLLAPTLRGEGTLRIDDAGSDPRYRQLAAGTPAAAAAKPAVLSYLAVPVVTRSGQVIGSMLFGHPEMGAFNARSERMVGGIAAQAAIAIDNTRMVEAAQQAAEERKILLDSERSARAEAERTSRIKDEFLATLSHELRTPLSAILGWSQVLRRGTRDQADLHRGLQTIERNARLQAQLIEDLLDMGRLTSGAVHLDLQPLDLGDLLGRAIDSVREAASAKQIQIDAAFGVLNGKVDGDAGRLQQVFGNLLSNALKFTPRGGSVRVALEPEADGARVTISDSGAGIRPEFLEHVFERFRQADSSTTRKHGGLGIGLAIVKHLVEQHGGAVSVHSGGEGQGASFTVQLPLVGPAPGPRGVSAATAAVVPPAQPPAACDLQGLRVLVVDDDDDARELIQRILGECHACVSAAASAPQALQLLLAERPDVLISDIGMPDVDGYDLLALVRQAGHGAGGDVPAIALTAFARPNDRRRALDAGFNAHIAKPLEPSQLIATVVSLSPRLH